MQCVPIIYIEDLCEYCVSECDTHCTKCDTNGANKCDMGFCKDGYHHKTADDTCERKYFLCMNITSRV